MERKKFEHIECRALTMSDSNGKPRIMLDSGGDYREPRITLFKKGTLTPEIVIMGSTEDFGPAVYLFDKSGKPATSLLIMDELGRILASGCVAKESPPDVKARDRAYWESYLNLESP